MKLASFNINFDSLRECLKLSGTLLDKKIRDLAFFNIMDRFLEISDEYDIKFTIFVIGKDLEIKENYLKVREWSDLGHEIGNHTYHHYSNFAELPHQTINNEINLAHEIIGNCTGQEPKGFVAPAWAYSKHIPSILKQLNYVYDTSLFPSYLMPLIQLKARLNSDTTKNSIPVIRKDFFGSIFGQSNPFFSSYSNEFRNNNGGGNLLMLPLPTTILRIPVWHTMSFFFNNVIFKSMINNAIKRSKAFYYLMHPSDLLDPDQDLDIYPQSLKTVERVNISLDHKLYLLKSSIELIKKDCEIVTIQDLASDYKNKIQW